jgi:hypothetical protein
MPGWLSWTLVGLGTWCAVSVPVAFLLAGLFGHHEPKASRLAAGIGRAPGR